MQKTLVFALFVSAQALALSYPATAQTLTVKWEVQNRFRFYRNATTFEEYAASAKRALTGGRENWILSTERQLQKQYDSLLGGGTKLFPAIKPNNRDLYDWNGWASLTRDETCWDRNSFKQIKDGRCEDYVFPITHTVVVTASGASIDTHCQWTITTPNNPTKGKEGLWKQRMKVNADLMAQQPPCDQAVEVEVPWTTDGSAYVDVAVKVVNGGASQSSKRTRISVKDILVVGMGDSFGAGSGDPDKPAQMDWRTGIAYLPFALPGPEKIVPVRIGGDNNGNKPTSAVYAAQSEWQDIRCFRSQYGPQFRTALHMAVLLEHTAVTYLDLSCYGARIIEGLLNEQAIDTGYASKTPKPPAQIGMASHLLCTDQENVSDKVPYKLHPAHTADDCRNLKSREICEYANESGKIVRTYQNERINATSMTVCKRSGPKPFIRNVDVLLLSIGGNDIGFAPMVGDVIIDDTRVVNQVIHRLGTLVGDIHSGSVGMDRLALLKSKYDVLDTAISEFIPLWQGSKKPIFLSAYPLPIDDAGGSLCGTPKNVDSANAALNINGVFSQFGIKKPYSRHDAPLSRLQSVAKTSCALNLRRFAWFDGGPQAQVIVGELTGEKAPCAGQASQAVPTPGETNLGWQFVPEALFAFREHGFCALAEHEPAGYIPEFSQGGSDQPWKPDYQHMRPYETRQRWIRTPNDAFVVTNWQTGAANLIDFVNLMAAATTTAMHPTAEGYAAMADALLGRVTTFICTERKTEFEKETLCSVP